MNNNKMTYTRTLTDNNEEDLGTALVTILNYFFQLYGQYDDYTYEINDRDITVTVIYNQL